MHDDIHWLGASRLLDLYRRGELSPVEVARSLLDRIDDLDPRFGAFRLVDPDETLAQARRAEDRYRHLERVGLLDGLPVAIKDSFLTRGWSTCFGSRTVDPDQAWERDGPTVSSLRRHNAVFVGKTTMPEFGWKAVTDSPLTGISRNPWDRARTPGGSSGGSGVALAAGFCPLAIGSDIGGSARIPAAFCNVVGLKPTQELAPLREDIPELRIREFYQVVSRHTNRLGRPEVIAHMRLDDAAVVVFREPQPEGGGFELNPAYIVRQDGRWLVTYKLTQFDEGFHEFDDETMDNFRTLRKWYDAQKKVIREMMSAEES